jgi:hypothetical protein
VFRSCSQNRVRAIDGGLDLRLVDLDLVLVLRLGVLRVNLEDVDLRADLELGVLLAQPWIS